MIISKEIFKKAIESINEIDKYCDALQNLKIDMLDTSLYDKSGVLFDLLLRIGFTEEGQDIIYWYLYERNHTNLYPEVNDFNTLWEKVKDMRI